MNNEEAEILDNAIIAFNRETKLSIEKIGSEWKNVKKYHDPVIRILTPHQPIEYNTEIKRNLSISNIGTVFHQIQRMPTKNIIIARYISSPLSKKMMELNIPFIDTAGNTYINDPPVLIFIHGNKLSAELRKETAKKIFDTSGLKIIFSLLCNNHLLNANYREISEKARVSLGSVSNIFKELSRKGYIIDSSSHGRRFQQKKDLFNKWIMLYAENLRPKNLVGLYSAQNPEFWKNENLSTHNALWGGEVAANKLTNYLHPEIITIYAQKPVNNLILKCRLWKSSEGKIEIRNKFWNFNETNKKDDIVPEILIYADLIASADSRNMETAKIIYEEYIERHLGEN
jgi:hypothetical protein